MKILYYLSGCFFLLLHVYSLHAQKVSFYKVPDRPNKLIATFTGIAQDKQGFIWLSSYQGGLHRYDGTGYTTYMNDPLNSNSLGSNYSECLMIDKADIIWIGFFGVGLDRFDRRTNTFTHYRHDAKNTSSLANDTVTSIIQDHAGNIWVGTYGGLELLDEKHGSFKHYPHAAQDSSSLSYNHVRIVYEDKDGDIWVGCGSPFSNDRGEQPEDGGLNKLNRSTGKFTRYLHDSSSANSLETNKVSAIFQDSKRNLWIGTRGNGLHSLDKKTGVFTHYYYDPKHPDKLSCPPLDPGSQADHIRFIKEDAAGALWIGSWHGGVIRYDLSSKKVTHYGGVLKNNITISTDTISGFNEYSSWMIFPATDSLLWMSSYSNPGGGNLYVANPFKSTVPYYNINAWITSFYQENDSIQWLCTYSGLIRKNTKSGKQKTFHYDEKDTNSISDDYPEDLVKDNKGFFWIATYWGLNKYNPLTNTFTAYLRDDEDKTSLVCDTVSCLFIDNNKNLWVGTYKGLDRMNTATGKFYHYPNPVAEKAGSTLITIINQDRQNALWIGTENSLYKMDIKTGKHSRYLAPLIITSVFTDSKGILWAGSHQGLYYYEKSTDKFQLFNEPNSQIVFSIVLSIQEDNSGNLWVLTPDAIVRINKARDMVKVFGENYGIKNVQQGYSVGFKTSDGKLYFTSKYGYYAFYPDSLNDDSRPKIYLTAFRLNDAEVLFKSGSVIKKPLWLETEIKLGHDQNNFSFDFLAMHYKSPGEEKYLYKLEQYDKEWHYAGKEHKAYFFNVPPGNYTLKIRAVNPDGQWAEKLVALTISPPWYKTWWAYSIFIIAFIGLIWGIIHYRSLALRRENRLLEEKVTHRTEQLNLSLENLKSTQAQLIQSEKMASLGELTAGIAHEIQNPLNFVNNFSDVNKELIEELKEEAAKGNMDEVKAIADDIKDNEEKINNHGRRADAIVKGMMQHSRQNKGVKEPTDINKLADEYLRLSYHGLRAKDKTFNADFKTDFDESIGKINIVPQDIGRVLLNLFNNAFYALSEKQKNADENYKSLVSIRTKKINNKVEISVEDNGNGIPSNIVDKIFQPFFTTKPTGQGTGLGLSLAYDIITKEHKGSIKVESKEGEGTTFFIQLINA